MPRKKNVSGRIRPECRGTLAAAARHQPGVVVLADNQGKEQRIDKSRIESREVSPLSPMPANWADQIPEKEFNNLLAYLLAPRSGK